MSERARDARVEADKLAFIAWSQRMLAFRGLAQSSPMLGDALNAWFGTSRFDALVSTCSRGFVD